MVADPAGAAGTAHLTEVYRERLWPGVVGWAVVVGTAVVATVALAPVSALAGAAAGVIAGALAVGAAVAMSATVSVRGGELVAGSAHIPVTLLGPPDELDEAATRHALGPGLDARTYVLLRGWVRTAVQLVVLDPDDPTPAWLVSTRRPAALAAAIRSCQAVGDGGGDGSGGGAGGDRDDGQAAHSVQTG